MIDTIILRLHGTEKYGHVIKGLDMFNIEGHQTESIRVKGSDVRKLRRKANTGEQIIEALRFNRTGEFLLKTKAAKHMNASNHYQFTYFINYIKDFIEFNFSIPKYNYGSNVIMFVDHVGDKHYNFHECSQLNHNIVRSYDLLMSFLDSFLRMEFLGAEIDYLDIEVHRIDVCFNQLFASRAEALKYLEYQKRKNKKYSRNEEGVMKDYETSLMYVSKRYSAKIYHKGTEYQKNDLKEHLKLNKEKKRQYFRTEQYQNLADKILRYELTIRNGMLNYLHKHNLFRKNCMFYKKYYKIYQNVENLTQRNDRIAKTAGSLSKELKEVYLNEHPYEKISSDERKIHKHVSRLITKRTYFRLAITEKARIYNKQTVDYYHPDALFSRSLLLLCMEKLNEFMTEYQIKELPPEDQIGKLIDDYNLSHRKKLPKREMTSYYRLLQKVGSFKDIVKYDSCSRATMYRYKSRFKKIGITENNLIPLTENGIPRSNLDLREYHWIHTENPHFLNKRNFIGLL